MAQHSPHHIKAAHIKTFEQWHLALSKVVMNIGLSDFESSLNNALHEVMNFDYLVIFAYHKDKKPDPYPNRLFGIF